MEREESATIDPTQQYPTIPDTGSTINYDTNSSYMNAEALDFQQTTGIFLQYASI